MDLDKQLKRIPTGYSDKLTAEHFIMWNKLKEQLKEDQSLNPQEKAIIADKLSEILRKYEKDISIESWKLSSFSSEIKNNINHALKIEGLKNRNYQWYTENDKKVMSELKEKYPEKYDNLILNHDIEFTEKHIIIYFAWKLQYDREDIKTKIMWKEKMTKNKAIKIAKEEWKKIDYRLHDLAEHFWNDFIVNLFQLKDWDYHTGYKNTVQSSDKFWENISVKSCDSFSTAWTSDTKEVDENYEAYVRLFKEINNTNNYWSITIIR